MTRLHRTLFLRGLALFLLLASIFPCSRAAMVAYVQPGKTDFDTVMQSLNPYGTWSQINGVWAYTPLDHQAPYTSGRWTYTDYGWCWKGSTPYSWATEHYGYWKLGPDKVWSWYPGPLWYPEIVELREAEGCIGWRPSPVDVNGDFTESDAQRYARPEEWGFVTQQEFAGLITPAQVKAHAADVAKLLDDSSDSHHTYTTYRELSRVGPSPILFKNWAENGTMFAPHTLQDELAARPPAPAPMIPGLPVASGMTTPQVSAAPAESDSPPAPAATVKYWVIMCLPTLWTAPPPDEKDNEAYLYRPDFYQDEDGIQRRVFLWLNPRSRNSAAQQLNQALNGSFHASQFTNSAPAIPAQPAVYQNPLDSPYNTLNPQRPYTPNSSSKQSARTVPSPAEDAETNAPPPPSLYQSPTNHAPVTPP